MTMVTVDTPRDGVALLEMGEPGKLNLWSPELENELFDALEELGRDPGTRVIGIVSPSRAFCAGANIGNLRTVLDDAEQDDDVEAHVARLLERRIGRILKLPKPVIAGINGACVGVGLSVALTCDIRYAGDDAVIQTGFPKRGLIAEFGLAWLLQRVVGLGNALDLLLTSRSIDAHQAHSLGLVSRVVPAERLREQVVEAAGEMVENVSPRSMAVIKQQVHAAASGTFEAAFRASVEEMAGALRSADAREGVESFLEKRPPRFPPLASRLTEDQAT